MCDAMAPQYLHAALDDVALRNAAEIDSNAWLPEVNGERFLVERDQPVVDIDDFEAAPTGEIGMLYYF